MFEAEVNSLSVCRWIVCPLALCAFVPGVGLICSMLVLAFSQGDCLGPEAICNACALSEAEGPRDKGSLTNLTGLGNDGRWLTGACFCMHGPFGSLMRIGRLLSMSSTRAITLRSASADDFDVLFQIASDMTTWEERTDSTPAPLHRDTFKARLTRADAQESGKSVRFVIDVDGATVGSVSLFDFDELARHAEVGIALVPEARGKGIGTAAISQIVEFAFVRCNLRRVHLQVIESNIGAIRVYEKAGFVIEGRQRQHAWVRGKYEDIIVMGILRPA